MKQTRELRNFGLIVGGLFVLIGIWPMIWHRTGPHAWALILGSVLVLPALTAPRLLAWPHRAWMALAHILGWVNTRIILGVAFFAVFTPMGLVMRLLGKDPMRRRFDPTAQSYRVNRTPRDATHMQKPF
jgi:Saxitoxin biosynthesis operon protein SxtJ